MFRSATLALMLLLPHAARATAIIEIDLVTGYPLADLNIEVSAIAPAQIDAMAERDVLVLPISGGAMSPGSFTLSFLGGLQLSRDGATAVITVMTMMGSGVLPEERMISGTAQLALDGVDQGVIHLDLDFCDLGPTVSDACLANDGSSIRAGVRVGLMGADALAVFQHLGVENIVVTQLGIWDERIRLSEPSPGLLIMGLLATLIPLRRSRAS